MVWHAVDVDSIWIASWCVLSPPIYTECICVPSPILLIGSPTLFCFSTWRHNCLFLDLSLIHVVSDDCTCFHYGNLLVTWLSNRSWAALKTHPVWVDGAHWRHKDGLETRLNADADGIKLGSVLNGEEVFPLCQVCQVSAQQPVQTELLMRYHQLQSRLATLKIENEEVRPVKTQQSACIHAIVSLISVVTCCLIHSCFFNPWIVYHVVIVFHVNRHKNEYIVLLLYCII